MATRVFFFVNIEQWFLNYYDQFTGMPIAKKKSKDIYEISINETGTVKHQLAKKY